MESTQFESFLKTLSASSIHISSYNNFILHELPLLVQNLPVVLSTPKVKNTDDGKVKIEFFGVHIPKACALKNGVYQPIYPFNCRRENLSYMTPVFSSIKVTRESKIEIIKDVVLAHIPVMLGSCVCRTTCSKVHRDLESKFDKGGYFIINGVERVLVTQRRKCYDIPQVLEVGGVLSVNMRSMSKETNHSILVELSYSPESNSIHCSIPYVKKSISLAVLVRAFGKSAREFSAEIGFEGHGIAVKDDLSEQDALEYIGSFATKKVPKEESDDEAGSDDEKWEEEDAEEEELEQSEPARDSSDFELLYETETKSISCSFLRKEIPLGIVLCALGKTSQEFHKEVGVEDDTFCIKEEMKREDALKLIHCESAEESDDEDEEPEDFVLPQFKNLCSMVRTLILEKIRRISYAKQITDTELFPHLGVNSTSDVKFKTLCSMARLLLFARAGRITPDDRDNLFFHRFETSGILLYELYNMLFRNFLNTYKECGKDGAITDFTNKLEMFITKNIKSCMAKGRWGIQKNYTREGVSQQLARYSIMGTQSHLHRVMLPVGKKGKNVKIRMIHPSHFGFVCLFETPEGQGCGVVLNFTSSISVTREYASPFIRDIIHRHLSEMVDPLGNVNVWIDNTFVIRTTDARKFVQKFKELRENNVIPRQVAIYVYEDKARVPYEVRIFCEKGRVIRPLLTPKGKIVLLDAAEIQNNYVAVFGAEKGWDYCEIHPVLLMSICCGSIPFSDHIQSPRIVYESSMMKQSIGFATNTFPIRYDTTCEVLDYAQKCMVSTKIGRAFGMHEAPAGVNCVVAIATLGSWNAEDCVILNKAAVERGLFSSTTYKTITVEEYKVKNNDTRRFCLPPEAIRKSMYNYSCLDANGVVKKGSKISRKDVIVGCVQEIVTRDGVTKSKGVVEKDCSELAEEEGIVEHVEVVNSFLGNRIVNIILKIRKIPECGDKFANLNAQKGTCGLILAPEDMPFCQEDGIIPDILVNPNALPSRMTISMFLEFVLGQECALDGEFRDATPFEKVEKIGNVLHEFGYDRHGMKTLINGTTGKPFRAQIFMGVNYYQKLKHMVSNKINARNFGNVTVSTRQPVSGRSKQGGGRAGEMEVQGWLSHGVGDFLKEKLFDCSDAFSVLICPDCKLISNHKDFCHICQGDLCETNLPYASKIVFQILNMCSIKTSFDLKLI